MTDTPKRDEYEKWNLSDFLHDHNEQERGDRDWVPRDVADAAIAELEAEVERLTWQRDKCAAFLWDCSDHKTEEDCVADVLADLERRWAERGGEK